MNDYPFHLAALLYLNQALLSSLGVVIYFAFSGLFFEKRCSTKWKCATLILGFIVIDSGLLMQFLGGYMHLSLSVVVYFTLAVLLFEKHNSIWQRMALALVFIVVDSGFLMQFFNGYAHLSFLFRTLLNTISRSFYVFSLFKCPFLSFKKLSAFTLSFTISGANTLIELLLYTFLITLGGDSTQWMSMHVFSYLAKFILFLLCVLVRILRKRVSDDTILRIVNYLSIGYLILAFTIAPWFDNREQPHIWIALLILFAAVSILVIVLISESAAKRREQEQAQLLSLQNDLMTERLESDKRLMDAVHQTRHDLHKHLDYVHNLLAEARTDEARQYIQEIAKPVKAEVAPVRTGCPAIDTVLQIEQHKASAQGITMEIVAYGLPDDCIAPADCNCILGNLLDNAIEAQAKVAKDKRYIQMSVRLKHDFLMINIKNAVAENPLLNNEKLHTTKKEQQNLHGIGLKSVEAAVERYDGELSYDFEDGWFTVSVLLCTA